MKTAIDKTLSALISPPEDCTDIREGDCLDILPALELESVHLVITDPPYFLDGLDNKWRNGNKRKKGGAINGLPVGMKFDPKQGAELQGFMEKVGEATMPILCPGAFAVFFSQPRLVHRMAVALENAGFEIRDLLAWHFTKRSQFKAFTQDHFVEKKCMSEKEKKRITKKLGGRRTPQLRPQFETMILAQKPKIGTFVDNWVEYETGLINPDVSLTGKSPSTLMTVEKPNKEKYNDHLTVKPVLLIKHLVELLSIKGQTVLDPFLGTGTTAIATQKTGRRCIGIEINPAYIEIAEKRIGEQT